MKWLHLTDIHYRMAGEAVASTQARDRLLQYINANCITADHLFITGDFRYGPEMLETDELVSHISHFIIDIATAAGVKPAHIHYVPGNHDVTRYQNPQIEELKEISKQYDPQNGHFSKDARQFLISADRYAFYKKLCDALEKKGVLNHWSSENIHSTHHYNDFNLICLNTSLFCEDRSTDPKNLLVGTAYFLACLKQCSADKPLIIIAHHSLDLLEDRERRVIEEVIKKYPNAYYFCGDAHTPEPRTYTHGLVEITMGSISYDGYANLVFCAGELDHHGVCRINAHSYSEMRWAEYQHLNQKLHEVLQLDASAGSLITKHESRAFSLAPEHFVGRAKEIDDIENLLSESSNPIVLVNGIGGMGKTEICRYLVHRYLTEEKPYAKYLAWITYTGDLKESFFQQFSGISIETFDDYWTAALRLINGHGRDLLLVIDNANELTKDDLMLLNALNCHLLLTSRSSYNGMSKIDLGELSEAECIMLYKAHSGDDSASDDDILRLINLVDRHTLAIELLAKTQKAGAYELHELCELYENSKGVLPDSEKIDRGEQASYMEHIAKIFDASKLSDEEKRILQLYTLLQANVPLNRHAARELLGISNLNILNSLTEKGWLQADRSIHPLISSTIRATHTASAEQLEEMIEKMGTLLHIGDTEIFTTKTPLLPHAEQLMHHTKDASDSEDIANLYHNCAFIYNETADYAKALEYYQKALVIREKQLGHEHPETATCYNNIGGVYGLQGDYAKALEYFQKALVIRENLLSREHLSTATSYNNIGGVYFAQGDYVKAMEHYQKALAIQEKQLGHEHHYTASSYNNIGRAHSSQGDYAKALENYQKAIVIREKLLGHEHSNTAVSYLNIGTVYFKQGNASEAQAYLSRALAVFKKCLVNEHAHTQNAQQCLDVLEKMHAASSS